MQQPISKRIPIEIANAQGDTMRATGIYYWFDDSNIREGKALIIGPAGTPYEACPLLFEFKLPANYPFDPPAVRFCTSDGVTRFHPNLYVEGKVCLSILGTWSGPKWSAIMNISTVLTSIQSLLDSNPITNEPGWEKYSLSDPRAKGYADFVQARLIELTVGDFLRWKRGSLPPSWTHFADVFDEIGETLFKRLSDIVEEKAAGGQETMYSGISYGMGGSTHWSSLLQELQTPR